MSECVRVIMSNITFQETGMSVHSSVCTLSGAKLKVCLICLWDVRLLKRSNFIVVG